MEVEVGGQMLSSGRSARSFRGAVVALLLGTGVMALMPAAPAAPVGAATAVASMPVTVRPANKTVRLRPTGATARVGGTASPNIARLSYHGGALIQNVKVDLVIWNRWGYDARVPLTGTRSVTN